jgi:hypothetical protein
MRNIHPRCLRHPVWQVFCRGVDAQINHDRIPL